MESLVRTTRNSFKPVTSSRRLFGTFRRIPERPIHKRPNMIKRLDTKLGELQITGTKNGIYHGHGRTELGVGEHDQIKKRLDEERHQDYRNHMARKERERVAKTGYGDSPPGREESGGIGGSVCDIGYETSMSIAHQRKQLNDTRKAEYVAHLAAQSASIQTDRHDGSNAGTQTAQTKKQDECTQYMQNTNQHQSQINDQDDRKQKQRDYAEALRQQIEEKKKSSDLIRRKEKEDDKKNMEMSQGGNQGFNYGSYGHQFNNSAP
ncbi:hypothetical protein GE061_003511 [Apolygus lucorum]|uniref:Uncharacterized protein n=1 Tax=Apolygus lucorum TaxID=248454 RepID=A0A8S9X291_APOLU|nr:hypothetical protein GE061_003511 [Apolygus lucorum]